MKRHFCAAAGALVLALAGAGTATAGGLPILGGQQGVQSASLGDQSVGEQTNDAGVTQKQGSFNVNVSPAIAILGDASTQNAQGNGNTAVAGVSQSNEASQSQAVDQAQRLADGSSSCCASGGQEASQSAEGGDQSVGEQRNDADVTQEQGNGNINISPAIAIGAGKKHDSCGPCVKGKAGDEGSSASTWNAQGNGNKAVALVGQSNTADQSQDVVQKQSVRSKGACCIKPLKAHKPRKPDYKTPKRPEHPCCGKRGQAAGQSVDGGDQSVGKQKNEADVKQEQGSGNVNVSPAIALGGGKHESCGPCSKEGGDGSSSASTWNAQGNGNQAAAWVSQSNAATQSQSTWQGQSLVDACREVMRW